MYITDSTIFETQKSTHRAQYTMARLMSPEEVEEATEDHDQRTRQRVRGHWFLCGDCSQEMFDDIVRKGDAALRHALGVIQRDDGTKFLVVTHQLGNAQHRFLVPMWDPRVPDLLDAVSLGRYSISLARKGDTHALVLSAYANAPLAAELRKHLDMPMPDPQQLQGLLQALPKLMETAAEPEHFPNLMEGVYLNYRTTDEIRRQAVALLEGCEIDDLDDGHDETKRYKSLSHGPAPAVLSVEGIESAAKNAIEFVHQWNAAQGDGVPLSFCVIASSERSRDAVAGLMQAAGLRCIAITAQSNHADARDVVHLATMHRAKGLEFDCVVAIAPASYLDTVQDTETQRKLLYVALTRAKRGAMLLIQG